MKLIRTAIGLLILFAISALVITVYLGPDDLRFCGQQGGEGKCRKADAIVVVSGGDTKARTAEGIKLYKAGYAQMLVLSGAAADKTGPSNAKVMQSQAVAAGIPSTHTLLEENSATTGENAANTMALVRQQGYTSIILVTSAYHQRRALLEFQHHGDGITIRSHPVAEDRDWSRFWFLTPWGWNLAGSEIVKSVIVVSDGGER